MLQGLTVVGLLVKSLLVAPPPPPTNLPVEIVSSDPPAGAIDARQPSNADGSNPAGWSSLTITFTGNTTGMAPSDFTVSSTIGTPPTVSSVVPNGTTAAVNLSGRIPPGAWTTIKHNPSVTQIVLGYLPGDVDANRTSVASDILALIDHLNGVVTYPIWQVDLDRSGVAAPPDILQEIDMLNGAGAYAPGWNGVSIGAQPQPGPCTFGGKYAHVAKSSAGGATGCAATIRTRSTVLCGEATGSTMVASSNAWVGVTKYVGGVPEKWAQIGYARDRNAGSATILTRRYAETKAGPSFQTDYELFVQQGIPTGTHEYRCLLLSPLLGTWTYEIDQLPFRTFTHNGWRNVQGTHYGWSAEIFNREDQMVGTATSKCDFTDCQVSEDYTPLQNATIQVGDLQTSNQNEWGIERVSNTAINVWDKNP